MINVIPERVAQMTTNSDDDVVDMHVISQLVAHKRQGISAFERLIPVFAEEAQMLIDQMRCAIAASDGEGLRLTAHKLKGSASVIGALEIRKISQEIMALAEGGGFPNADLLVMAEEALGRFNIAAGEIIRK
jgi:HPt (histidine-containing phosphotransfer) domain-containing protein